MTIERTKFTATTVAHPNELRDEAIDWAKLYERMGASQAALKQRLSPSPEEKRRILRARARSLAARDKAEEHASRLRFEVVEFVVGPEHYAIESSYICEIHPLSEFTPLPCTPAFVLGLINVRGQILSIIDIKKLLGLPEKGLTELNKVIIVQSGQMEVGILADAIVGVRLLAADELYPSLPTLTGIGAEYVKGITREPLVVLDMENILSDERLIVDEEVNTAT
jgi:purine-binding chemotaxis protein CheW